MKAPAVRVSLDYRHPYHDRVEAKRQQAESLVRGMEVLAREFTALEVVPLDVLDRAERLLVELHTANLLRLEAYNLGSEGDSLTNSMRGGSESGITPRLRAAPRLRG